MECPLDQALQGTLAILTRVRPKDLGGPTPCASWDVRALVNHFAGTARWWAATLATMEQLTYGWDLARAIGRPADLDPRLAAGLLSQAGLASTDAYRGPNGQALFGPAGEASGGAGPAGQLAAFLGRAV
jgi:hypothetical protein